MDQSILDKILNAANDTYVIFYVNSCFYCRNALELLRKSSVQYKGYDINQIEGNMGFLLGVLNKNAEKIGFNSSHRTKPIIFYNKKFIGGYDKLVEFMKK